MCPQIGLKSSIILFNFPFRKGRVKNYYIDQNEPCVSHVFLMNLVFLHVFLKQVGYRINRFPVTKFV